MSLKIKLAVALAVSFVLMAGIFVFLHNQPGSDHRETDLAQAPAPEAGSASAPEVEKKAESAPAAQTEKKAPVRSKNDKSAAKQISSASVWGGWTLAGRIVREGKDAAGENGGALEPVAGATVWLKPHPRNVRPEDNPPPPRKVVTGPDGIFTLADVPARMSMRLEIDEPSSAYRTLSFSFQEPGPDSRKEMGDLYLDPAGTLALKLVGPKGEPVLKGQILVNKRRDDPGKEIFRSVNINESRRDAEEKGNGDYILERAPLGPLYIEAKAPGYAPSGRLDVEIPRDEPFVVTMSEGLRIAGTVLASDGKPIAGASLDTGGTSNNQKVKTDASGHFAFDSLSSGDHDIAASADGYVSETRRNVLTGTEDVEFTLAIEAVFSGRVLADTGTKGIPRARITLRPAQGSGSSFNTEADADGKFQLKKIAAGTFTITADHPEYATTTLEEPREFKSGEKVEEQTIRMKPGFTAIGKVLEDATQAPVADAQVTFQLRSEKPNQGALAQRNAKTNAEGAFEAKGLSEGTYRLNAVAKGYMTSKPQTVTITADGEREFTITLEKGASISGRITDLAGAPVAGATVQPNITINNFSNNWNELNERFNNIFNLRATTDADGRYRIEGLAPHPSYMVLASHRDFAPARAKGLAIGAREALENVDLQLTRGGTIRGRVLDETGQPIPGANVAANPNQRGDEEEREWVNFSEAGGNVNAGPDGAYAINHLATGSYRVSGQIQGRTSDSKDPVDVVEGKLTDRIDLVLGKGETIAGRVIDDAGTPIVGADVQVYNESGARGRTDGEGKFTIAGLKSGPAQMSVSKSGFENKQNQITVPSKEMTITLGRAGRLSGVVRAKSQEPLGSFQITAISLNVDGNPMNSRGTQSNDPGGKFDVEVGAGTYTILASVPGYAPTRSSTTFTLKAGERVEGIVIDLQAGGIIQGVVVVAATGEAVSNAQVSIQTSGVEQNIYNWGGMPSKTSGADGTFILEGVPEGTVSVLASHSSYAQTVLPGISVSQSTPAKVRLELKAGGGVYGVVRRAGEPMRGARLNLWQTNTTVPIGKSATTDAEGKYEIKGLAAGDYVMNMYVQGREGSSGRNRSREAVGVFEGQMTEVNFDEEAGIRLYGRITQGGQPVSGGNIMAILHQSGEGGSNGQIDGAGRYSLEVPGAGEYSLLVNPGRRRGGESGSRVPVTVPAGVSDVPFDIELPAGEIAGEVVDAETGEGVPNAQVIALTSGGSWKSISALFNSFQSMASTDSQGQFAIGGLAAGTYTIRVMSEGYSDGRLDGIQVRASSSSSRNRIPLERGFKLVARVVTSQDQPISQAAALLRDASGELVSFSRPSFSDAGGNLEIHGLMPGSYRLTVNHQLYAPSSVGVTVGQQDTQGPAVVLEPGGKAQVQVTGRNGRPVEGAEVQFLNAKGENVADDKVDIRRGPFSGTLTGKGGSLSMDQLPPGVYRVVASKGKTTSQEVQITIVPGETAEARISLDG